MVILATVIDAFVIVYPCQICLNQLEKASSYVVRLYDSHENKIVNHHLTHLTDQVINHRVVFNVFGFFSLNFRLLVSVSN